MSETKKGRRRPDIIQNTPEWLAWRKIGGSDAAVLMGISPWCSVTELYERKLGLIPDIVVNAAMQRGHDLEPEARLLLEIETGLSLPAACYEDTEHPFLTASVDGISSNEEIISEIKCPGLNTHLKALNKVIPAYYIPQCQHNMGVTGAKLCYYYSYLPDNENVEATIRLSVLRDEDYIGRMRERCIKFQQCLDTQTPPDEDWFGVKDAGLLNGTSRSDPAWKMALKEFLEARNVLLDAKLQYKARVERIEQLMSRKKQMLVIGNGVRLERIEDPNGCWRIDVSLQTEEDN